MQEWNVYEMKEVLSPTGKPYIGSTEMTLRERAYGHKYHFNLNEIPELVYVAGPFATKKEARRIENEYRVANGWTRENEHFIDIGKAHVESGHLQSISSKGGKVGGKMLWINKDGKNTRVHPDLLQQKLDEGWVKGVHKK